MSRAKYLIRIDDICEGLKVNNFYKLIDLFNIFKIRPIIAVIPSNKDKKLIFPETIKGETFWSLIRKLEQDFKWKVGIHGYEHNYITNNAGLLKINNFSEFAGLDYAEQYQKLKKAIEIMSKNNVSSDLFIAPGHSFDKNTLKVLKNIGVKSISDGFYNYPGKDKNGLFWIPQQLWNFSPKVHGVWTINFHINEWKDFNFIELKKNLEIYQESIVDYEYVINYFNTKKLDYLDNFVNKFEINKHKIIRNILKIKKEFNNFW